uniref:hypothetical protein n=1 Tax=Pseudonocardia sp. ICBG601 TaxID=2846759 RepID=UPI001CF696C9
TITLDELTARMDVAFGEVRALLRTAHERHQASVAALAPAAERLREARALAAELGAEHESVRVGALTRRLREVEEQTASDPLAEPSAAAPLGELAAEIEAVAARLTATAGLRGEWDVRRAAVEASVADVDGLRRRAEAVRERAVEIVVGPVPELPPDRDHELRGRLAALGRGSWTTRAAALRELSDAVAAASAELTEAHELVGGLVERRAELRGRFEAYAAKAARTGVAERPDVLTQHDTARELLWSRPCDLAAATRALVAYQRAVGRTP